MAAASRGVMLEYLNVRKFLGGMIMIASGFNLKKTVRHIVGRRTVFQKV